KELLNTYLKRGKQKVVKQKLPSFMDYLENYFIKRSEKGVRKDRKKGNALSKDTVKTYNTLLGHLKEYNTGLDWKDINMNFHAEYTEFLTEEYELSSSSIGKDISIVKLVCREAYHEKINDEKINKYDDYADPYFTVSRETANSIYLTTDEINLLWNLDLSKDKSLEETRDLFVLGCITGLRYSDYSKIKKEQVDEFKLHVKTVKGGKQLEVNIRDPKAQAIIKKYNIHFPQGAVNQVFNRNLREICKDIPQFQTLITKEYTKGGRKIVEEIPKYEMIKSHTARRSYVTNEVKAKTPIAVIMNNSGHTSEKSFWKYVKLNKGDYFEVYDKIMKERNDLKVAS
ncbi:MAG TPA: phage integrase SAM-like domain-containing protein, partial [Chitinophagaceae bacterium]|nr:phage integrase SAM-like domain-containing protein [Chitinophagaceae bacterium]